MQSRHSLFVFFSVAAFGLMSACNEPPPENNGWPFGDRDGSTGDVSYGDALDTDPGDTSTDSVTDAVTDTSPDARAGEWRGWYRHGETLQYFVDGSEATIATAGPGSGKTATCQVLFEPSDPEWGIQPAPNPQDLWRLRQPSPSAGQSARPPLSDARFGFVRVSGELTQMLRPPITGRVSNASTTVDTCKSLKGLGRCSVPNAGDLCYNGIEPFSVEGPVVTLDVFAGDKEAGPGPNRIQYDLFIDFAPAVADAGRFVDMVFTVPRYGPADGTQIDWTLSEVTDGKITRNCTSWGAVSTIEYPLAETTGWLRRIRAQNRNSDKELLVVNLKTGVGQRAEQPSPQPDAGRPPDPDCSTAPMEFWFGVEYAPK